MWGGVEPGTMRKLSNLLIAVAVSVWSYQIAVWAAEEHWNAVTALHLAAWLGWIGEPGGVAGWLLGLNLGVIAMIGGVALFYGSFPWAAYAFRSRTARERRDLAERARLSRGDFHNHPPPAV